MGGSQLRGGSHRPLPKELKTTEDAGQGATKAPWSYRWLAVAGRARQTRSPWFTGSELLPGEFFFFCTYTHTPLGWSPFLLVATSYMA